MKRFWTGTVVLASALLVVAVASSQPPRKDGDKKGPPEGKGPPPRFELGRVLPPPLVEELELTREQHAEIAKLEKEVKERLSKILTAEQKKKVENFRPPRGPGGPPPGGPGKGPPGGGGERPPRGEPPDRPDEGQVRNTSAGIQWYATWESGLREAQRTGRPILLVSAAPHCAGVSGTW